DELGYAFDLVLLGEQFRTAPPVFADAWPRLTPHIVHAGFLPDRNAYLAMLPRCDLVVSTAIQENFGIGVIEAILAGCRPLLPKRLAYPEIVYDRDDDLFDRLRRILEATRSAPESSEKPLAETQSGTDVPASEWLIDEQMSDLTADLHRRFAAPTAVERMDDALSWLVNS
ncbi:MAG: glycosyltransferase, partial [Phycisphaerae bacterium]